jgi:hypothetical protein
MDCRLTRWYIDGERDEAQALPADAQEHLAACAECRRYQARGEELGSQLRRAAAELVTEPRPQLAEKVLRRCRRQPPRRRVRLLLQVAAAAAAVALAVGLIVTMGPAEEAPTPTVAGPDKPVLDRPVPEKEAPPETVARQPDIDPAEAALALSELHHSIMSFAPGRLMERKEVEELRVAVMEPVEKEVQRLREDAGFITRFFDADKARKDNEEQG